MIGFLLCAVFGLWFAKMQLTMLKPDAAHAPPWLMFGTGLRVTLLAFIPYAWCHAYLTKAPALPYAALWPLISLLALLSVYAGAPIELALRLSLPAMLLAALAGFLWRRGRKMHLTDRHWLAFAIILAVQVRWNGYFSPLALQDTPLHVPGMFIPQIAAASQLLHSFVWIKQFSLASTTYFYWLITPSSSVNFESPLLQLLTLFFNSASSDIMDFYRVLHWVFFIACVGGSFGFYLLLHAGMRIRWSISTAAGMVYLFIQEPFFTAVISRDHIVAISTELALPFGLCAIFCALREKNMFLAALSGAGLALSCVLLSPHPELMFEMLYCFAIPALAFAYETEPKGWKDHARLFACSAFWFIVLTLFHVAPPLLSQLTGELYTSGHSEAVTQALGQRVKMDVYFVVILHFYVAVKSIQVIFRKTAERRYLVLPTTLLMTILLLAAVHSPLMVFLSDLFHMPADMEARAYGRRGCFIAIFTLMLLAYAMEKADFPGIVSRSAQKHLNLRDGFSLKTRNIVMLLCALALCWPLHFYRAGNRENPQNCRYYIMLDALLANDMLLKGDSANADLVHSRLQKFENDTKTQPGLPYREDYEMLLKEAGLTSANDIHGTEQLYAFAKKAAEAVDAFYLDGHYNCVHPAEGKYDDGPKLTLLPNLASLYSGLSTPFLSISGFTAGEMIPDVMTPGQEGSLLFGMGQGLFVHNGGTDFDARFMVGPPMLQGLYLHPGLNYTALGKHDDNRNWFLEPSLLFDPLYRKLFDIAGFDIITLPARYAPELEAHSGFSAITPSHPGPLSGFNQIMLTRNEQSYGIAYLANHVTSIPEGSIMRAEEAIRQQLIYQTSQSAFQDARSMLYAQLQELHDYRDILLEDEAPPQEEIPQGDLKIENILGEAAVMKADCKREACELVYNYAALPGWYAYVDGKIVPIHRANFAFMAIRVPRGVHEVWFVYAPASFFCFTLVSLLGFILLPYWYLRQNAAKQE